MTSVLEIELNITGKGENAHYQHFTVFPQMFSNGVFLGVVKTLVCVVDLKLFNQQTQSITVSDIAT